VPSTEVSFLPLTLADFDASADLRGALVRLNNEHAVELSIVDEVRLRSLLQNAFLAARVGMLDAFLIAFDQNADYDSPNFCWFRARSARFVYIDRVVTAAAARGQGLARALYGLLFERARAAGHDRVVCEVNAEPPNPVSDAFHASLGFQPVGTGHLGNRKIVTYLERAI
jgi:uncharacterized protein